MNQYDLSRAASTTTAEPVAEFDFSLLSLSPTYPITVPAPRRMYPLRVSPETRKRKPLRRRAKFSAKLISAIRAGSR